MSTRTIAGQIANLIQAIENCDESGNWEWRARHCERLQALIRDHMPSGSGIDTGTYLAPDATPERLAFDCSFHHMDESGGYCGWTDHRVTARASLLHGLTVTVGGRNRNGIKDYLGEVFYSALSAPFADEVAS